MIFLSQFNAIYFEKVYYINNTNHNYGTNFDLLKVFGDDYDIDDGTYRETLFMFVDLARGHYSALNKISELNGYNVFNLGTGKGTSVLELINKFKEVNNIKLPYKIVDRRKGDLDICFCDPNNL